MSFWGCLGRKHGAKWSQWTTNHLTSLFIGCSVVAFSILSKLIRSIAPADRHCGLIFQWDEGVAKQSGRNLQSSALILVHGSAAQGLGGTLMARRSPKLELRGRVSRTCCWALGNMQGSWKAANEQTREHQECAYAVPQALHEMGFSCPILVSLVECDL